MNHFKFDSIVSVTCYWCCEFWILRLLQHHTWTSILNTTPIMTTKYVANYTHCLLFFLSLWQQQDRYNYVHESLCFKISFRWKSKPYKNKSDDKVIVLLFWKDLKILWQYAGLGVSQANRNEMKIHKLIKVNDQLLPGKI